MPSGYRLSLAGGSVARTVVSGSKSLEEQIREIQKLISDAEDTLAQAKWALETLVFRVAQEDDGDASTGA
jgi:phage shock protein A